MLKKVVNCYYCHKSNVSELLSIVKDEKTKSVINGLCKMYALDIIKYDKSKQTISLIECKDWDCVNEPEVGTSIVCNVNDFPFVKIVKPRNKNPQIYHHKWMFVSDDYRGFDVNESKKRTELLNSIDSFHDPKVKRRIGNKDYWVEWCSNNGVSL